MSPSLISSIAGLGDSGQPGPMEVGGKIYSLLNGTTTFIVYESSDAGLTWTRMDSGGEPTGTGLVNWAVCTDGSSMLYVVYPDASFDLVYVPFNTLSGTWGSLVNTSNTSIAVFQVAYRASDTSLIICVQESDIDTNLQYCIATIGGSASGLSNCSNNAGSSYTSCWGIVPGAAADLVWFVFNQVPVTAGTQLLQIQSLTATALGAVTNLSSGTAPGGLDKYGFAAAFSDGTTIAMAWSQFSSSANVQVLEAPTSTMVFVAKTVPTPASSIKSFSVLSSVGIGVLLLFGLNNNTMIFAEDSGGGFGAFTVLTSAPFSGSLIYPNVLVPASKTGWSIIFTESSGVYYLAGILPAIAAVSFAPISAGVTNLPSMGALCRYASLKRCARRPFRTILTAGPLVYGGGG
jgi:hypothetical protein